MKFVVGLAKKMRCVRHVRQLSVPVLFLALGALLGTSVLFHPQAVLAQNAKQDFVISELKTEYWPDNSDKQGKVRVVERFDIHFFGQNHGILRAIPEMFNGRPLHVTVVSVKQLDGSYWPYGTYRQNDNLVLKIGDADKLVSGEQSYIIEYTLRDFVDFSGTAPAVRLNVNGDQTLQSTYKTSAVLHLPDGGTAIEGTLRCYTGKFSSTAQDCTVERDDDTVRFTASRPFESYENMTIEAQFLPGYFTAPTRQEELLYYAPSLIGMIVPPIFLWTIAYRRWRRYGKDPKGRGIIVPEYAAPDKLSALQSGAIMDYALDPKDMTALLITLAVKRVVAIIEEPKKGLFAGNGKTYSVELVNTDWTTLDSYETQLLTKLFPGKTKGDVYALSGRSTLYTTMQTIKESVLADLTTQGYFVSHPAKAGVGMLVVGILTMGLAIPLLMLALSNAPLWRPLFFGLIIGVIVGGLVVVVYSRLMAGRTAAGVAARERLKGLKLYITTAEADRIKMMQSPKSPYAQAGEAPQRTVELFEKLLPYAIVFGVEKDWAAQFNDLYKEQPDWYRGNISGFNSVLLASHISDGMRSAVGTSFAAPSSGGSGSSGGFSGGGAGGGGTGGW